MNKPFLLLSFIFGSLLLTQLPVQADANFSIKKNENQYQTKDASFYDLLIPTDSTAQLSLTISNNESQTNKFKVSLYNGLTNNLGQISYAAPSRATLPFPSTSTTLSQLNAETTEVEIAENQSKEVLLNLTRPSVSSPGIILGAIHVSKVPNNVEQEENKNQKIVNHYSAEIPVVIRTQPSSTAQLDLQLTEVTAGVTNKNKSGILAKLANPTSWVMPHLSISTKVYQQDNNKLLYQSTDENLDMSPHSTFDYSVPAKTKLKAGHYYLDLVAKSGKNTWHFTEKFTVSSKQVKEIANNSVQKKNSYWWLLWFLLLIPIFVILLYLYRRRKKKTKENN